MTPTRAQAPESPVRPPAAPVPIEAFTGELSPADHDLAVLAASACASAERLQSAANAALIAVLASAAIGLAALPAPARQALLGQAAVLAALSWLVWTWQTVLAARQALDARVFEAFARAGPARLTLAGFDQALQRAGLRQAGAPRPLLERWQGARRLLLRQAGAVAALVALALILLARIGVAS